MAPRKLLVLALFALSACQDREVRIHGTPDDRDPPESQLLDAGSYIVTVDNVAAASCAGMSPRDLIGQQIGGELGVSGEQVVFELNGWELVGEMVPGAIFVEGAEEPVVVVVEDEDDVDYDSDEDVDTDSDADTDERPDTDEPPPEEGEDCGEEEPEERPDEPVGRGEQFAALDARILDEDHAVGRLTLIMSDCSLELEVSVAAGELPMDDEPGEVDEEAEAPREDEAGAVGSDESDCG